MTASEPYGGLDKPALHHMIDELRGRVAAYEKANGELRAEVERLREGLYPLSRLTPERADALAESIGASPDSLFVAWITERKRAEDAEARLAAPRHCRACGQDVTVEP